MSTRVYLSPLEIIRAGKWHSALFTTYALSLGFFEGAVLPSLQRAGSRSTTLVSDSEGVVGALSEAGARHVGRAYAVEPVTVAGGVFHAKLCSLVGENGPHLVVGSGNLTFGGWGCNVEVIDHLIPGAHAAAFADVATFLAELPYAPRVRIAADDAFAEHIEQLRNSAGDAVEGPVRVLHNLDRPIPPQLVEFATALGGAERLTIVSPYFGSASAVEQLAVALGLDSFEVHVASRVAVNGEHFPFHRSPNAAPIVIEALAADGFSEDPLHAKLIEILCARGRLLVTGSINASQRALAQPINIELGVLRIFEDRTILPRAPHSGPLPQLPERVEAEAAKAPYVARCEYAGGVLRGTLLCPSPAGEWSVSVDVEGDREQLGTVEVTASGDFGMDAPALERIVYSSGRTVLTFARGDDRARGFLSFIDVLSASRRLGAIAAPLLRIAAGSDNDEDWIGILEWFARNPEQTVSAWRSTPRKSGEVEFQDELVPLASLAPQADESAKHASSGSSVEATLDRLLARLRLIVRSADPQPSRSRPGNQTDDEEDREASRNEQRRRAKLADAFDRLVNVLAERVPSDPATELRRLAELGVHVLQRHAGDAERILGFLRQWIHLACEHLRLTAGDAELRKLTVALVGLAAAYDGDPKRARRQLLEILKGELDASSLTPDAADADLRSVVDLVSATVGLDAWAAVLNAVADTRVGLDDVRDIIAALAEGRELPELATLEHSDELIQLKKLIARGKLSSIYQEPRTRTGCPRCNQRLAVARLEQFRQFGLVRNECCSGIMLRSDA